MIAFVHGVPETASIWRKVREALGGDGGESVALSLPGFGCPRPAGFGATKDDYAGWLIGQLEQLSDEHGPVDLVGHDWGALLTYWLAGRRPDLLRSWVADVGNVIHPDYEWHAFAQVWQTPGDGEAFVEAQADTPLDDLAAGFADAMGLDLDDAREMAASIDRTMGSCILELYRSSTPNLAVAWSPWEPSAVPGLVLHVAGDPFSDEAQARATADALGANFEVIDGSGHFWPYEAPAPAAALLRRFWASLA